MHATSTPVPVTQPVLEIPAAEPKEAVMHLPRTSPVIDSKAIPRTPPTDVLIRKHGDAPTKQPPTGPGDTYWGRPCPQAATNQEPACEHPAHGLLTQATPVGVACMAPPSESFDYDEELRAAIALSLEGEDQPDAAPSDLLLAHPITTPQIVKTPTRELIGWVASAGRSKPKAKTKQDPPRSRYALAWTWFSVKLLFELERDDGTAATSVIDTEAMD